MVNLSVMAHVIGKSIEHAQAEEIQKFFSAFQRSKIFWNIKISNSLSFYSKLSIKSYFSSNLKF